MRRDYCLGRALAARFGSLIATVVVSTCLVFAQSLTWLGTLPTSLTSSAVSVSADGSVVVGNSPDSNSIQGFRWTAATGIQPIDYLLGYSAGGTANDVSNDGSTIVGYAHNNIQTRAFRWTQATGTQDLGVLSPGSYNIAYGVSADGSVVVGESGGKAFRWTAATGMQNLGTLVPQIGSSIAYDVSADGSVVVGSSTTASALIHAFRWTAATGMQDLGTLGGNHSRALGVSADGSVVVGWADVNNNGFRRAFRWTAATGMQDLGTFGGSQSEARGASATGSVVVGRAQYFNGNYRAFRWTPRTGMEDLNQAYWNLLTDGSYLTSAYAISPNGRYIVGVGYNAARAYYGAFLLDTGAPYQDGDVDGNGCVDDADLLRVLFAFGQTGFRLPEDLNGDQVVDDADLLTVLFNFGSGC